MGNKDQIKKILIEMKSDSTKITELENYAIPLKKHK